MPIWSWFSKEEGVDAQYRDGRGRAVGAVAGIQQLSLGSDTLRGDTTASQYKYGVQTLYDPGSEVAVFE